MEGEEREEYEEYEEEEDTRGWKGGLEERGKVRSERALCRLEDASQPLLCTLSSLLLSLAGTGAPGSTSSDWWACTQVRVGGGGVVKRSHWSSELTQS